MVWISQHPEKPERPADNARAATAHLVTPLSALLVHCIDWRIGKYRSVCRGIERQGDGTDQRNERSNAPPDHCQPSARNGWGGQAHITK